jgi:hypothetical protein
MNSLYIVAYQIVGGQETFFHWVLVPIATMVVNFVINLQWNKRK